MNGVQLPMLAMPVLIFVAMMVAAEVGRRLGRVRWLRSDDVMRWAQAPSMPQCSACWGS